MPDVLGQSVNNEVKFAFGRLTSVTASDSITVPGLRRVRAVVVSLESNPADANLLVSAVPSLTGNTFTLKTWKTDGSDPTPAAATSFGAVVNYIAAGD